MQHRPAGGTGYQDPLISIQDGTLLIRRYYFPTGTKRIRLASITGVQQYPMTMATGRGGPGVRVTSSTGSTWTRVGATSSRRS